MRSALFVLIVVGCSSDPGDPVVERQLPEAVRADAAAIVRANNQFAVELYARVAAGGGNAFLSPFSISTALAIVDAGAVGTTDAELRAALHFTLPGERTHTAYGALLTSLETGRGFGGYTLATANRLFGQTGKRFLDSFLQITRRDYRADLVAVDFARDAEGARQTANDWVSDHTDGKIPELFGPGAFDASTQLAAANAIVFKGAWQDHFKVALTAPKPFHLASGATVQAPLMYKSEIIATADIPGGRLSVLPFRGKDLSMIVVAPSEPTGLGAIEAQLSADALAQWIAAAVPATVPGDIILPRFDLTSSFDLPDALKALGIAAAFDPGAADFSAIDGERGLYLGTAIHKATITVNEEGAEAAAATGVAFPSSLPPPLLEGDRPFVFFIYDHVTGAVLFMGRLADPTS